MWLIAVYGSSQMRHQRGHCDKEDITAALDIMVNDASLTAPRLIALRDLLEQVQPVQGFADRRRGGLFVAKVRKDWEDSRESDQYH